jgi:hypothetical protein
MGLAIKNQFDHSRVLTKRLSENKNLISAGLDFYDTNTQYKMKTVVNVALSSSVDPIVDFAEMITSDDADVV